jgi:hypothetical protein
MGTILIYFLSGTNLVRVSQTKSVLPPNAYYLYYFDIRRFPHIINTSTTKVKVNDLITLDKRHTITVLILLIYISLIVLSLIISIMDEFNIRVEKEKGKKCAGGQK